MKHIVISGNYGATNLGDEAILKSILQTLSKVYPDAKISVMTSHPGAHGFAMVPAGVRSFFRGVQNGSFRKTLKVFKECDLVLFGGGGLFTDEKPQAIF